MGILKAGLDICTSHKASPHEPTWRRQRSWPCWRELSAPPPIEGSWGAEWLGAGAARRDAAEEVKLALHQGGIVMDVWRSRRRLQGGGYRVEVTGCNVRWSKGR